jgi:AcrR family transcriptional regulator
VSIGSLYQYFPGKTALMAAVIEREADADLDAMRTVRMIASKGRGLLCDLLVERRSELAPGIDPSLAAMILGSAVEAAAHNAVFERTDTLTNGALARELSTMCRRYLLP